jgi:Yip1 domain
VYLRFCKQLVRRASVTIARIFVQQLTAEAPFRGRAAASYDCLPNRQALPEEVCMSTAPALPAEEKPLSEVERVVDTFIAPTKTFTDLRRSSNWLLPAALLVISTIAMIWAADSKIGFKTIVDNQLAMQPKAAERLDKLSPEDRARQMETIIKFNRIVSYCSPVIVIVYLIIVAAVLLATFNFGLGTELTFNQCVAVCMYTALPGIIKALLAILVILLGATGNFTFQNPIASNLGGLVDPSSHFLYSLFTSIDVFTIWTLLLAGIAFSCLTKVKRSTCLAVVFGWWLVFILAASGVGAAFS